MTLTTPAAAPPPFGIYTPVVIFFHPDETIDYENTSKHVRRLLLAGVRGLVIHGSNGEATHLLPDERLDIIRHAKKLIQEENSNALIIAGCSANSVRETLVNVRGACEAGADYALILPPNYWAAAMTKVVIKNFYTEVRFNGAPTIARIKFRINVVQDCSLIPASNRHIQLPRSGWWHRSGLGSYH